MVPLLFRLGSRGRTGTGAMMPGVLDWSTEDAEEESERAISGIRGGRRTCSWTCVPSSIGRFTIRVEWFFSLFQGGVRGGIGIVVLCIFFGGMFGRNVKFSKVGEEDGVGLS